MRRIIILILFATLLAITDSVQAVDYGLDGQVYGGYCVVLNGETQEGFVYANSARNSMLIVIYPGKNKAFIYSADGQNLIFADDLIDLLRRQGLNLKESVVSFINRAR